MELQRRRGGEVCTTHVRRSRGSRHKVGGVAQSFDLAGTSMLQRCSMTAEDFGCCTWGALARRARAAA